MIEGLHEAINAVGAFFASAAFLLIAGSFLATWLLAQVLVTMIHRPWRSGHWRACPLAALLAVAAVVLYFWHGQPHWILYLAGGLSFAGALCVYLKIRGRVVRIKQIVANSPGGTRTFEGADLLPSPIGACMMTPTIRKSEPVV